MTGTASSTMPEWRPHPTVRWFHLTLIAHDAPVQRELKQTRYRDLKLPTGINSASSTAILAMPLLADRVRNEHGCPCLLYSEP